MAESGPNIAPFLDLAVQIIQASGGDTKRADEAAHILASSTAVNTYPSVEGLVKALEDAKLQINYLHEKFARTGSGNGVVAQIDSALSRFRSLQNGGVE